METKPEQLVSTTDLANQRTTMAEERTGHAVDRTRWAADRTLWASDRTFIAWLRTAISLIGFGITIGKAGDALQSQGILIDSNYGLRIVGISLIVVAVLGLVGALIQDIRIGRRLKRQGYGRVEPTPLSQVMGFCVLGIGIMGAVFILV